MIEINLIPDVKLEYLKARRMRNTAVSFSIIAGLAATGVVVAAVLLLLTQLGFEKLADNAIDKEYEKLSKVEGLSELRTLQNQLSKLPEQNASRSMSSRLFSVLQAINPAQPNDVRFTSVKLDPATSLLSMEGLADAGYPAIEALKKTITNVQIEYKQGKEGSSKTIPLAGPESVELSEMSYGQDSDGKRVLRFKLAIKYPADLFTNRAQALRIVTPTKQIDVTDSHLQVPDSMFGAPARDPEESGEED